VKFYRCVAGGLTLTLRVTPRAAREAVQGTMALPDGMALKVAVTAPADRGKANAAVCELLAQAFRVPTTAVSVVAGETDRRKVVRVAGEAAALARIAQQWMTS
jgi:uncharacterized protein (TIGR00251 family)